MPEVVLAVRAPGLPENGEPLQAENPFGWAVPRPGNRLVGREQLVEQVATHLRTSWLVTLTGIGGVGKTRLAVTVAESVAGEFVDGRAFVDLAPVSSGQDVLQVVADALQVTAQPGGDLTARICRAVGDRAVLIVLDNCEHVLGSVASLVESLGGTCRRVTFLATSRERLHVDGEHVIHVAPLPAERDASPAVDLLVERIGEGRHLLEEPATLAALRQIARQLDGVPLALELAAARCRTFGVPEVARRLPIELASLADRGRPLARHQTLESAIDWSYHLLSDTEQAALNTLSVFAGPFNLDAAEQVIGSGPTAVDETVASLIDKSLIERDPPWYRLLEPTRHFAERKLASSGGLEEARSTHSRIVAEQVHVIHDGLHGREEADWVRILDALWPDVRTVVRRCFDVDDADTVTDILVHLAFEAFWRRPEAFTWIDEAVERYGDRPSSRRHELLGAGGLVAWVLLDVPRGISLGEQAVEADPHPGTALDCLPEDAVIGAYNFAGRYEEAIAVTRRAVTTLTGRDDRWNEAIMRANLAISSAVSGSASAEAVEMVDRAVALGRAIGNPTAMAYAVFTQGLLTGLSDPLGAALLTETAKAWAVDVRNQWLMAQTAVSLAASAAASGDDAQAMQTTLEAAEELLRTGWITHAWATVWGVIEPLHHAGRTDAAALLLGGCEASGVARFGYHTIPDDLAARAGAGGDERLQILRSMGTVLPLSELIRVAAGLAPVPPVVPAPTAVRRPDGGSPDR